MFRLISIAVVCTMLLIPIAGFSSNIITNGPLLIAVSFGLAYFVIPAYLLHIWPSSRRAKVKSMSDALWDGELRTTEHQVRAAVQIEEVEDEGLHFLLSTGDGRTLSLSGQYLYAPVECQVFPSEGVRVFTHSVTGQVYGVEAFGQPLDHWDVYDSSTMQQGQVHTMPALSDGEVHSMDMHDIVARMRLRLVTTSTPPR